MNTYKSLLILFSLYFCSLLSWAGEKNRLKNLDPFLKEKAKDYNMEYHVKPHPKSIISEKFKNYASPFLLTIIREGTCFRIEQLRMFPKNSELQILTYDSISYYYFFGAKKTLHIAKEITDMGRYATQFFVYMPHTWYQFLGLSEKDLLNLESQLGNKKNFSASYIGHDIKGKPVRLNIDVKYNKAASTHIPSEIMIEQYFTHKGKEHFDHLHSKKISIVKYQEGQKNNDKKLFSISSSKVKTIIDHDLSGKSNFENRINLK